MWSKGSLHVRRAVGVALLVRDEGEAEALGEGGHLRHRHHVAPVPDSTTTCVLSIMHR